MTTRNRSNARNRTRDDRDLFAGGTVATPNRFWHELTPAQQDQARTMFHPIGGAYSSYTYELGRTGSVLSRRRLPSS